MKTREFDDIQLRHCNAYNQNTIDRWIKGCIPPFPKKIDLRIATNYGRYNPYIHSGQDLQCSITQPHRTQNWENTEEEPKWLSEKSIHDITNLDYPSNSRRCSRKKPPKNKQTSGQHYYSSTSPSHLTPYTKGRWSKYFSPTASPKKPSQP